VELRLKIWHFEAQNASWLHFICTVPVKWLKLVPDFDKALNGTQYLKENSF
jgi:hypothetical protein